MFAGIIDGLWSNAKRTVSGKNLLWHVLAIVLTAIFVLTGFDWSFYEATRSEVFYPIIWAAGIGGFFVPILAPVILYIVGEIRQNQRLMSIALAIAQAALIAIVLTSIYKVFTGRVQPDFMNTIGNVDTSREFQFGFLRYGIYYGWPSSHVALAFAGGAVLLRFIKNMPVRALTILYMAAMAVGAGIGFHWFSDVVAGGILGALIGTVVYTSFVKRT